MHKVLRLLILNDLFFWTALGFIGPILAIYINDDITGGTLGLTGLAMAIFWIIKSITALLTSKFTDKEKGNKAELYTLIIGSVFIFLIPFGYLFANTIIHIIIVQAIFGFANGLVYPGWMTIFTRFIDKGKEGYDWSLDSASLSLGNGVAIGLSGFIAEAFGFNTLFYIVIAMNFLSLLMVLMMLKYKDEILSNRNVFKYLIRKIF